MAQAATGISDREIDDMNLSQDELLDLLDFIEEPEPSSPVCSKTESPTDDDFKAHVDELVTTFINAKVREYVRIRTVRE